MSASLTTPTRLMSTWMLCLVVSAVLWQRSEAMPAVSPTSDDSGTDVGDLMYVIPYKVTYNGLYHYYHNSCGVINGYIVCIYTYVYYYTIINSLLCHYLINVFINNTNNAFNNS